MNKVILICPAYAGVIPAKGIEAIRNVYLSRVCGGDPTETAKPKILIIFVPRMRG